MNGIFFENVGAFEKVPDENKKHKAQNFDETVHVENPQFAVNLALYAHRISRKKYR